jgi:flagella basal body P-ring formation protein FlgA
MSEQLHQPKRTTFATVLRIALLLAGAAILAMAMVARADSVRLLDQTAVQGPTVTLAQVAELQGPQAENHASLILATFDAQPQLTVTLQAVQRALTDAGVNWGLLSLRGFATCKVDRVVNADPPAPATDLAPAASNISTPIDLTSDLTLRGLLVQWIEQLTSLQRDQLRIALSDRDDKLLNRALDADRYEFEPMSSAVIGRLPITIRRYHADEVAEQFSVTADVRKLAMALVVTRTIGKDQSFAAANVQLREVELTDEREPVADPALVIGQMARSLLRDGAIVYPNDVRSPVLVKRGELITVRCVVSGLVIRTVGRASHDGAMDERITVRNEASRQTYLAKVTGLHEAMIEMAGPAEQKAAANDEAGQGDQL